VNPSPSLACEAAVETPGPYNPRSEVPLAARLFPADGVTWVVSLPTGLAADTVWPDMAWIEALAPVPEEAETDLCKEARAR
jgi:hypothetical protein